MLAEDNPAAFTQSSKVDNVVDPTDEIVNVLDIILLVNCILGNECDICTSDINQDGIWDVLDVVLIINHILDISLLNNIQIEYADLNNDQIINVLDIIEIINIIIN